MLWNNNTITGKVVQVTAQQITCTMVFNSRKFTMTAVYGFNEDIGREELWKELEQLQISDPWILFGDWNATICYNEKMLSDGQRG